MMIKQTLSALSLALLTLGTQAACPTWSSASRFELHDSEVIDLRTGLVWQRCSAGQSWNGSTCAGTASTYSQAEALSLAKQANPSDSPAGWRLPNVKELASLADLGCTAPAIDTAVFPGTPAAAAWSATPNATRSNIAWKVDFSQGSVSNLSGIGNPFHVRLVRSAR
ncbi:Lcl C-terminal domain-containing protein [Ideonella paludis]|uniref:DUF1566 domain-containing protein n=1 Tax=Ideonella paludis TaxID=1233411 RepID=A0ABS5DTI3_9BURK|nr:DUF1566 domain-containing protein [Ideonella paludis]MBQ0934444.1 DUF1566 domain-containing protein [Ideonella paludis]